MPSLIHNTALPHRCRKTFICLILRKEVRQMKEQTVFNKCAASRHDDQHVGLHSREQLPKNNDCLPGMLFPLGHQLCEKLNFLKKN